MFRAFLHRPQRVAPRRWLFQVHLWLGVITALYVVLVSVTGAALMFRIDMQKAWFPELLQTQSTGTPATLPAILASVQRAYPEYRVSGVDAPTVARPTALAYVSRGREFRTVLADPVTARVLGELSDASVIRFIQDLHFDLLGGRTGRIVNGVGGLALLGMCLTGLVIWWPGLTQWRRALTIDTALNWKRVNFDLHSAVGFWTLALVMMWAVTGANFAFGRQIRSMINAVSPLTVARTPVSTPDGSPAPATFDWSVLIAEAQRHHGDGFPARLVVPSTPTAPIQILFAASQPTSLGPGALESVYLDQYSGALLAAAPARQSLGDAVMAWMTPLHVGSFGGAGVKMLWFVTGLAPGLLAVTGLVMWWNRVLRERWARRSVRPRAAVSSTT